MAVLDVLVPQMSEGLQEVVIVNLHKQPGDFVKRDELIYSIETDKAIVDVESPHEGVLTEWLVSQGDVASIGDAVARVEMPATPGDGVTATAKAALEPANAWRVEIPARTRAHCAQMGISDEEIYQIPSAGDRLAPADVDAYLAARAASGQSTPDSAYIARPLTMHQRLFVHRLHRSAQTVIPATIKRAVDWTGILRTVIENRGRDDVRLTEFLTCAYCIAQAVGDHPKFRSTLTGDEVVHEFKHLNLGIAVGRPNNDLVTAVVRSADSLGFVDFILTAQKSILAAREGLDQASGDTQFLLTYMGAQGVVDALPVLVHPAIAVLFIGASYVQADRRLSNLVLTYDHRLINGVEAAEFMITVADNVEQANTADLFAVRE